MDSDLTARHVEAFLNVLYFLMGKNSVVVYVDVSFLLLLNTFILAKLLKMDCNICVRIAVVIMIFGIESIDEHRLKLTIAILM